MEQKNRLRIALAIILLITLAMFTSFGRVLFTRDVPRVSLAPVGSAASSADASTGDGVLLRVEVTPQTVQEVVRTLSRANSYYRELTVETLWSGGSSSTQVLVWADQGWTHGQQTLPSGAVRHDLEGEGVRYAWYDGDEDFLSVPVQEEDADGEADLSQRIPTYEMVLSLDPERITTAGYEERDGVPCVYVEYQAQEMDGYRQRFWVSVDSGLLQGAEILSGEDVVYRMSAQNLQTPCPSGVRFALPNGEALHQAS